MLKVIAANIMNANITAFKKEKYGQWLVLNSVQTKANRQYSLEHCIDLSLLEQHLEVTLLTE